MDDAGLRDRPAATAAASSIDWLPPQLVERMLRRRGRLHPFETLAVRRTALVAIDLTVLFAGDAANAAVVVDNVNRLAAAVRGGSGVVACVL
jgi:ureidoacrylate peracid hydrolase